MPKLIIFLIGVGFGYCITFIPEDKEMLQTQVNMKSETCLKLSKKHVNKSDYQNYDNIEWNSFYSSKYDACIHTEEQIVGNNFFIGDLSRSIMKGHLWFLLNCDSRGADRVRIDDVLKYRNIDRISSELYLDDGDGGPSRSSQPPSEPWQKERCQRVFYRMLDKLKD